MVKRIIFDLDRTLIPWNSDWDKTVNQTFNYFGISCTDEVYTKFWSSLVEFEKNHKRFNKVEMSRYFDQRLNLDIPDDFVDVWTSYLSDLVPETDYQLIELLNYLSKKYSLVVCTNWFKDQQVKKLKKYQIYQYFDDVITCDDYDRKPNKEIFIKCIGEFSKDEVVMVGDSYSSDIKGAMDCGLYSYYLTTTDKRRSKRFKVIKSIYELKEYL